MGKKGNKKRKEHKEIVRKGEAAIKDILANPEAPADPVRDARAAADIARFLDLED